MKPIFCIDITTDKDNEAVNGTQFITATASLEKSEELEEKQKALDETVKRSQLPLWIRIIKYVSGILAVIVAGSIVKSLPDLTVSEMFKNAPALIIGGLICGVLFAVLQLFSVIKQKAVLKEDNAEQQAEHIDKDITELYNELNVPQSAHSVDVLAFCYKVKDNEPVAKAGAFQTTPYVNLDLKAYSTGHELNLADVENVFSFPISEMKAIKTVNKRIALPSWNKEEEPTKGEYKPYKMTVNNVGDVFVKPYHILEIEHEGEIFGIYFPCYELSVFESLTGLKAEE